MYQSHLLLNEILTGLFQLWQKDEVPKPDYLRLHEIARHVAHSSETLATAIDTVDSLISEHDRFCRESSSDLSALRTQHIVTQSLQFQLSLLKSVEKRSLALDIRLRNEINLVGFALIYRTLLFSFLLSRCRLRTKLNFLGFQPRRPI
jgi:hypothetical protein